MPPWTTLIGAGVTVGLASTVAIPAVAGALGFGAKGIAAGSTAASWMASGAGSTPYWVSILQSIGATGAISNTTAAVTGAATSTAAYLYGKIKGK